MMLDNREKERANRFHFPEHRRSYIHRHAAYRQILARHINIPTNKIQISISKYGKPFVNNGACHYNTSHSKSLAILALSEVMPLGIDIEYINPDIINLDLIKQVMTSAEQNTFQKTPSHMQANYFFNVWTAKEAFVKAIGKGLSISPSTISTNHSTVSTTPSTAINKISFKIEATPQEWYGNILSISPQYHCVLVTNKSAPNIIIQDWRNISTISI